MGNGKPFPTLFHEHMTPSQNQRSGPAKTSDFRLQDLLPIPWRGLRADLVLHPGPIDYDGQRSWILEDPVRGNNFRLGYAEGELIYRLTTEPDVDAAVRKLFATTPLRPTVQEILSFVIMLQRERLAVLTPEDVLELDRQSGTAQQAPEGLGRILRGNLFFRIPLLRPDRILHKSLPALSLLWSMPLRWFYLICGLTGLVLTAQQWEAYVNSVNYLFTPQGALWFFVCLVLLKIGHEFAHACAAKAMGLHVRSMGVLFIIIWPLLYTDTTDVWKVADRRRRMIVSAAGVLFELCVGGVALLLWVHTADGILRSILFFLSGTSILSSVLVNLNPFMRYDGYYVLMDAWGIDNLRPRSIALVRHVGRRVFLGWRGPPPEVSPFQRRMIIYGVLALIYRVFIGITIAVAAYYLFFPLLGVLIFLAEFVLFILYPLYVEFRLIIRERDKIGAFWRCALSAVAVAGCLSLLFVPLPEIIRAPGLLLQKNAIRIEAPTAGRLATAPPSEGAGIAAGEPLAKIGSEVLAHDLAQATYELKKVNATIRSLGSGGEEGAYRKWLQAERKRLETALDKYREAAAQLEIVAPVDGAVVSVNPDLYEGAYVAQGTFIATVARTDRFELTAYVHERYVNRFAESGGLKASVHFSAPEFPNLTAYLVEKRPFPVRSFFNETLFDVAGGPIPSVADARGRRARDAWFAYTFSVENVPERAPHGLPANVWLRLDSRSLFMRFASIIFRNVWERGF